MEEGTIFFEYVRPTVWPPVATTSLHRIADDRCTIDFVCFPDGHLALIVNKEGRASEHHFQRVSIPEGAIVKIAVSWGVNGVSVAAGGALLSTLDEGKGSVLDLKVKGHTSYTMGLISFSPNVLSKSSREEWLFLMTLVDISQKINTASRYGLIRMSALLRQLLCDEVPLIYVLTRKYRLKIAFEVAIKTKEVIPEADLLQTSWVTLFPTAPEEAQRVDLERFLKLETITHRKVTCNVGDVIDVVAHVFGGVHYGQVRSETGGALQVLGNEVFLTNESMVLHLLFDIARVTLRAAMPLAEAIVGSYSGAEDTVQMDDLPGT
ncbi:MAG TPA: hypothetical protein VI750_04365 [Pyrinomonadaceae bacterium]|nr:hypothetical protein [Pyrinomonadaceae bacterium]